MAADPVVADAAMKNVLLFLAVLGTLSALGWLAADDDDSSVVMAVDTASSKTGVSDDAESALDRLTDWTESGGCSCLAGYDDFEDVGHEPQERQTELFLCCVKEYCGFYIHRDRTFCNCVNRYYGGTNSQSNREDDTTSGRKSRENTSGGREVDRLARPRTHSI